MTRMIGATLRLTLKGRLYLSALLRELVKNPKKRKKLEEAFRLLLYLVKSLLRLHLSNLCLLLLNKTVIHLVLTALAGVKLRDFFKTNSLEEQIKLTSLSMIALTRLTIMKVWFWAYGLNP
jgi:hypothetical protein